MCINYLVDKKRMFYFVETLKPNDMQKYYRLKKEALPYFDKKYYTSIKDMDYWDKVNISKNALEKVDLVYLTYGIDKGNNLTTLNGWSGRDSQARFDFTINFNQIDHEKFEKIKTDSNIRIMMERIQDVMTEFIENEL